MQLDETQMRKDFEKWCENGGAATLTHVFSFERHPNLPRYLEGTTEICWLAWRAALRAQADARPVGFIEQRELDQLKNGCVARVFPTKDEPHDVAVFTHPEASAPGLSDDERQAIEHAIQRLDFRRAPEKFLDRLRAILTRASAATVAEATVVQSVRICPISDVECAKKCGATCNHEAAQQQAEPGADELWSLNVELGAALSEARPPKLSREQTTALLEMVNTALSTGAAQSGQRAGVAEDFLRICEDEAARAALVSLPLKLDFAKERGLRDVHAVHAWMVEAHRKFTTAVKALRAAAPTQQQEGGK